MRAAFRLPFVQTLIFSPLSVVFLGMLLPFATAGVQAQTTFTGTVDFGTVNVASSGASQTLTFNFSSPTALNVTTPVQVLTTGVANLDFKSDGTGTCGGSTYSSCTVGVIFSPTAPGLRQGAVVVKDPAGNVLVTAYIHGAGHGPQVVFDPGLQSTIGTATDANGLAADGAGNVYVADAATPPSIYKVAPGGTQTTVAQLSSGPDGVAVDGAGNVYVAVPVNSTIEKVTPAGVTTQIGTGLGFAGGLAVDGMGNLYVAQVQPSGVVKIAPDGTQTSVGTGLTQPSGVAVDASGNIFIANTGGGSIVKIAPGNIQTTLVSGLSYPGAITVDPSGNFYVPLELAGMVVEYSPAGTQLRTFGHTLNSPSAVALDALGNLYINSGVTQKFDRTPPTVGFLMSSVGVKSTDSPKVVTLEDIGNDTLTFPVPASGTTNPTISSSFSLDSATTCPQLTSSSGAAGTLAMGTSCLYSVDFTPTTTGTITGSLVVTDNSLNVANATQTVALNNQGTPVIIPATVTVISQFGVPADGNPHSVTVTTVPAGLTVTVTYQLLGSSNPATTTPPSLAGIYMATAVVTQAGYSGGGSGYLQIVSPPTPVITWATPAPITVGTPLNSTQLDATANTPGTFTYSIPAGTVLAVGFYPITVNFVAKDTTDFSPNASKTVTLVVQPIAQPTTTGTLVTVNVGTTSATQTLTFKFLSAATLGSTPVQVLTQGVAGLDFKNTNGGSCAAGAYAVGAMCTVTVSFRPAVPGPRLGSIVLLDSSGNAVGTAFIGGVGQGPQVVYDPGVKSIVAPSVGTEGLAIDAAGDLFLNTLSSIVKVTPAGVQTTVATVSGGVSGATAIDGAGNIYTLNLAKSVVYEITPSGAQYQVGSGWVYPTDLAVDTAGNLYVTDRGYNPPPDTTGGRLSKVTAAGIQSTVAGPFVNPEFVAVDSAGNVYVTDNAGLGIINPGLVGVVYKVFPGGATITVASGLFSPGGIAVDPAGNLFVGAASTNSSIDKITPAGVRTKLYDGQVSFPGAVKLAPSGDLYVTQAVSGSQLVKFDRSDVPSLTFQSTTINTTSADSPQVVTVDNIGNTTLNFAVPSAGTTNASVSANFSFTAATTCPTATHSSTLASGASCIYSVAFLPTSTGAITGAVTQTDNNLNVTNAVQAIPLTGTGAAGNVAATVMLSNVNQTYTGSPLSVTATTNPVGLAVSVTYNGNGTPPTAVGTYAVVATITASGYTGSTTGSLVISQATPVITWANPVGITYGTALSAVQLNATASVAGTFVYTPAAGATLNAGTDTLSVVFTPTDAVDYTTARANVSIVVSQGTPVITWANPAAITYGTALSPTQLNATASVPGTFAYTPAAGTVPGVGTTTLNVTFTPTDATDYTTATTSVSITVTQATPTITWTTPAAITYGTALSATQLNATASVPGTFAYTPAAGAITPAGTDTLSVTFTPTDATDYTTATATVSLVVNQTTPVVTWPTPADITYGTALSAMQLNATASVPGTFSYTPAAGTIPPGGTDTLSVTFTPTDATDYTTATKTVQITVSQATPVITWANPAGIPYGTALSATQLNATASVPGTFSYAPAAGTIPSAGTDTLSVTFTPTDTTDYATATKTVSILVSQATPVIMWANPASITYGTALSATQLNATASVPGTFVYSPAAGAVPVAGTDTLSITFTPTDTTDYATATKSVSIMVTPPAPVITWANPVAITYGTPLSATQLDATASVSGTFAYNPAAGTVLLAGSNTLNVTFTPTDTADYTNATKSVTVVVNPAMLTVSASNATRVYGAANPTFTGSVSGNQNGDTFSETFSTSATALSNVGTYPIVPAVTGSNLTSYTQVIVNGTLTITQAGSTTALGVSSTTPAAGQTVTLTAQVASARSGTPTGSVQFLDGTTVLNTATLSGGTATFATTAFGLGAHSIAAVYLGDTNFTGSNSGAAVVVTVSGNLDFTISAITQTQTVIPGAIVSYSFNVAPVNGTYPSSVSFAASGLPPGATATFSPSSIAASGGPQTVTVAIQTSTAVIAKNSPRSLPPITLALLLLPLAAARRFRKSSTRMGRTICMLLLLGGGAFATTALSGCGTNNGFFGQSPKTYSVTITATSGTVSHAATVTLDLE